MIQEACNNIVKHADADRIDIQLQYLPETLNLTITDNGKGFDPILVEEGNPKRRSAGLKNIRNRASLMQGTVTIYSEIDKGSSITIQIPINKHDNS